METSLVMITSVVIVNTATMILGDTTLLGCILSECLKQKLKSLWQPVRAENYIYYKEPLKTGSQKKQHSVYSFAFVVEGDYFLRPSCGEVKQAI